MASEIACGPPWPLFGPPGVNIISSGQDSYGIDIHYEEQSDDEERGEDDEFDDQPIQPPDGEQHGGDEDHEQPPDEKQGEDPVLLVFLMLKRQACTHWGKQARHGYGDDEKQNEDPSIRVFLKFMCQLCRNRLLWLKHPQKLTVDRASTAEIFLSPSILWGHRSSPFRQSRELVSLTTARMVTMSRIGGASASSIQQFYATSSAYRRFSMLSIAVQHHHPY
jgi:hypothetical protein